MTSELKLILVDPDRSLCEAFRHAFAGLPNVEVIPGRFEGLSQFDCVVSSANSFGLMDGGVDLAIVRFFGPALMQRVQQRILSEYRGEQPVGTSLIVETSHPKYPFVAHTPTMRVPTDVADTDSAYRAMWALLLAVDQHNQRADSRIRIVACPGLGTGTGGMPYAQAAGQMSLAYRNFLKPLRALGWEFAQGRQNELDERMGGAGNRIRQPRRGGVGRGAGEGDLLRLLAFYTREPLRTIRAHTQRLAKVYQDRLDATGVQLLTRAANAAARVTTLFDDVHTYSWVCTAATELVRTRCGEAIATAVAALEAVIRERKATVAWDDDLPTVLADPAQLVQLFQNLIENALKFHSTDRPAEIRVSAVRREGDWEISVADNGIGIEPQYLERIFGLGGRLHSTSIPGSGIGLATCKVIVERHGGRIWATSEGPGRGTTVSFTLPAPM